MRSKPLNRKNVGNNAGVFRNREQLYLILVKDTISNLQTTRRSSMMRTLMVSQFHFGVNFQINLPIRFAGKKNTFLFDAEEP